jgi:hypothetical protein
MLLFPSMSAANRDRKWRMVLHAAVLGSIALLSLARVSHAQTKGDDSATVVNIVGSFTLDIEAFDGQVERVRLTGIGSPSMADLGRSQARFAEYSLSGILRAPEESMAMWG